MTERETQLLEFASQVAGTPVTELKVLAGDASFRRYFRVQAGSRSFVVVDAPPPESLEPFVSVALAYQEAGLRVPAVLATAPEQGMMAQEDFGDQLFGDTLSATTAPAYYAQALALLPQVARVQATRQGPLPGYHAALLRRENDLFKTWLLERHLGLQLTRAEQQLWQRLDQQLVATALEQPQVGVHRDYHSRNLMWVGSPATLGIIDFQDAVRGPVTYDVVSLLRDCYVRWPQQQVSQWLDEARQRLQAASVLSAGVSAAQWQHWTDWMGLQRHLKASGIFARLWHRDHKDRYLADIPNTLNYVLEVAARDPALGDWHHFMQERVLPAMPGGQVNPGPGAGTAPDTPTTEYSP